MGFVISKQLTNARPPKADVAELVTTPTKGNMRLSEKAAQMLKVSAGDYVGIVEATGDDGILRKYIHKGWADEKEGNVGSKLASPNGKVGGSLLFSSAYSYQALEGNDQMNRHFNLGDGVDQDEVTYFPLDFAKESPKIERAEAEEATA